MTIFSKGGHQSQPLKNSTFVIPINPRVLTIYKETQFSWSRNYKVGHTPTLWKSTSR